MPASTGHFIQSLIADREHPYKRVLRSFIRACALLLRELPHVLSALRRHQLHRASRSMDLPAAGTADEGSVRAQRRQLLRQLDLLQRHQLHRDTTCSVADSLYSTAFSTGRAITPCWIIAARARRIQASSFCR